MCVENAGDLWFAPGTAADLLVSLALGTVDGPFEHHDPAGRSVRFFR